MIMKNIIKKINSLLEYNNHKVIKFIQLSCLFVLPFSFAILFYNFNWFYLCITLVSIILISKIGHSIGQHRYFCHKSFKTTRTKEIVLLFLSTIATTYSAIYYSAVHRYHHMHSDKELDPHNPVRQGRMLSFLGFIDNEIASKIPGKIIKDLLKDPVIVFCHRYYLLIICLFCFMLIIIDPLLLLFCYMIPVGYTQLINGTQIVFGHGLGYQNFDTGDKSSNNIFWNWVTLGEGLHNNHHHNPAAYDFAYTKQQYEYDISGMFIKYFFKK